MATIGTDSKRRLFLLLNSVWTAHDHFFNDHTANPVCVYDYLFTSREEAIQKAETLDYDKDIYNECALYVADLSEAEILELSGNKNFTEFEKQLQLGKPLEAMRYGEIVDSIITNEDCEEESIPCANYDFGKRLEGSILVYWKWVQHVGYARKCVDVCFAGLYTTACEAIKRDEVYDTQCDILLTAEEVAQKKNTRELQDAVQEALDKRMWQWTNFNFAASKIAEIKL